MGGGPSAARARLSAPSRAAPDRRMDAAGRAAEESPVPRFPDSHLQTAPSHRASAAVARGRNRPRHRGKPESASVLDDPIVEREDPEIRTDFPKDDRGREVKGVGRSNRLPGKRLAGAEQHGRAQGIANPRCGFDPQPIRSAPRDLIPEPASGHAPMETSVALDESQVGSRDRRRRLQGLDRRAPGSFFEEPAEERTRLHVERHRSPRTSSSRSATMPSGRRSSAGGLVQVAGPGAPRRTTPARASWRRASSGSRPWALWGTRSTTGVPRFVTVTRSPAWARRTNSLRRLLRVRIPTDGMSSL